MAMYGPRETIEGAFGKNWRDVWKIKKIANNTFHWQDITLFITRAYNGQRVTKREGITLHITTIMEVLHLEDGTKLITIDSGGYKTKTTKDRINTYCTRLGFRVTIDSIDGVWWVKYDGKTAIFFDWMCLQEDMENWNPEAIKEIKVERTRLKKLATGLIEANNNIADNTILAAMKWARGRDFETRQEATQRIPKPTLTRIVRRYLLTSAGHQA